VTKHWLGRTRFTNYAPLIDKIMQFRTGGDPVCLVTFNYDLLLDRALISFGYNQQPLERHFEAHPILKLFKPHGSVNWARFLDGPPNTSPSGRLNIEQLIEKADTIKLTDEYLVADPTNPHQMFEVGRPIVPAIAIPVQTKTEDTFEWPPRHRAYLEELLPAVTKILIVGWQAREAHFLQMLRSAVSWRGLTHLFVVGKNAEDARAILNYFAGELGRMPGNHSVAREGFSQFVVGGEGDTFIGG